MEEILPAGDGGCQTHPGGSGIAPQEAEGEAAECRGGAQAHSGATGCGAGLQGDPGPYPLLLAGFGELSGDGDGCVHVVTGVGVEAGGGVTSAPN